MRKPILFLFLPVGLVVLGVGVWLAVNTISFQRRAVITEGKVVALEPARTRTGSRRRNSYRPVFEFKDASGQSHQTTESFSSSPALWDRGEKVTVLYDASNPERAHIKAFTTLWFGPALCTFLGVVFSVVGAFMLRSGK